jgi:hypothetical protein
MEFFGGTDLLCGHFKRKSLLRMRKLVVFMDEYDLILEKVAMTFSQRFYT